MVIWRSSLVEVRRRRLAPSPAAHGADPWWPSHPYVVIAIGLVAFGWIVLGS